MTFSQQIESPGAKIVGKRTADLPSDGNNGFSHVPIDLEAIQEFQRLSGECLDDEGLPVAGVSVQLFGKSDNRNGDTVTETLVMSMVTGDDGKFDFVNLQEHFQTDKLNRFFVMALRKEGFATAFSNPVLWETDHQQIQLARRAMVKGVIRNELGEPVSDADVSFYHPLKELLPNVYSNRSDKTGRFQIDDFHAVNSVAYIDAEGRKRGSQWIPLIVHHPDYGVVHLMIDRTPNLFEITIRRGARFSGRIVNDMDEPVAGCKICLQSHQGEEQIWFETTSDAEGNFNFVKLPDIRANLFFQSR